MFSHHESVCPHAGQLERRGLEGLWSGSGYRCTPTHKNEPTKSPTIATIQGRWAGSTASLIGT